MRRLFGLMLLFCLPAFAKSHHAPLPDAVLSAKSVYLDNRTGNQSTLDTAYDQFQKWGRFNVVQNRDSADLIVVFTHDSGLSEGTTIGFTQMNVFVKDNLNEPVFETTERYRPKIFGDSSTKECVGDFRRRLNQEHK